MHTILHDDGNKYDKLGKAGMGAASGHLAKYAEALRLAQRAGTIVGDNAFAAYGVFLLACAAVFVALGGRFQEYTMTDFLELASTLAEAFGLLMVRRKISMQKGVHGLSAVTMIAYTIVYTMRLRLLVPICEPGFSGYCLRAWIKEVICVGTVVMVFDILWSIFRTYRSTYAEELDVFKAKYLIPGCLVLALLLHPDLSEGLVYTYFWTFCLYLDVMALMPQVIMMTKGGGKVQAPIAHFVAATFLSRCADLTYWCYMYDMVGIYSAVIIIFFHVLHLVLVMDFMYYYLKARLSGASMTEDLDLQVAV